MKRLAMFRSAPPTLLLLFVALASGCSHGSGSPHDSPGAGGGGGAVGGTGGASASASGGTGGTGGGSSAGIGGVSGASGTGGANGTGGAGSGGASAGSGGVGGGQAGGGAGSGGAGAVQTTTDCSTHSETNHCFSVRGKLDATAFDFTCLVDTGGLRTDVTINKAWALSCKDSATSLEVVLTIPKQTAGPFTYGVADQDDSTVNVEVWKNSTLATASSKLDLLVITGNVKTDMGTVITGTFQAAFSAGTGPGCAPDTCASATVAGSFRSVFDF